MKGIICKVCKYVALDGSAPEKCPVCGAPKASFEEIQDAIKTPQDPNNKTEGEKKHVPVILVVKKCGLIPDGCMDAHVKVGEIVHPMLPEHFIGHIDFYIDKVFISRVILTPGKLNPAAALHLRAGSGKLTAIEICNVHGTWISETDL